MNRNIIHTLLVVLVFTFSACNDFLNNVPKGMTIPQEMDDYQKLLNSQTFLNLSDPSLEYLTDNVHLLNKDSKYGSGYVYLNKSEYLRNLYSFKGGQVYVPGTKDGIWNGAYSRLFTLNSIINEVMGSKGGNENAKKQIKAEALFARAYQYYNLVNIYGKHYNKETSSTDLGVPYITKADINQKYHRHTVAEVYDMMLADLNEAAPHIPEIALNKAHPNQAAVNSFYAKLHLSMGNYQESLKYANAALKGNDKLLNLNEYEMKEGDTWGRVHKKGDETERLPDIDHPETNYAKWSNSGAIHGTVLLSREMRDIFASDLDGAIDLRKEYYYSEDSVKLGANPDYFPGECAFVLYANHQVGLTSTENYFIAAECEARVGSKDRAMDLINIVRDNRMENNTGLKAANNKEALNKVIEEKRREFCFRGPYRFFDLKRFNLEPDLQKTVVHTVDGDTFTLPPNDPRYVFPVNNEILEYNPDFPMYER